MRDRHASITALVVALNVLRAEGSVELAPEQFALARAILLRAGGAWAVAARHAARPVMRATLAALERSLMPGLGAHHAQRKRAIASWLDTLAHPSARQVLVLGAGFDGLSLALSRRHPNWRVRVADHPATLAQRGAVPLTAREDAMACDLLELARDSALWRRLIEPGCADPLVMIEGVLMYLPEDAVRVLLRDLREHAPRAEVLMSFAEPVQRGGRGFARRAWFMRAWLGWQREPFRWRCTAAALARQLSALGYTPRRWAGVAAAPCGTLDAWLPCFGEGLVYATSSANTASAASSVASISASVCALETKPASNADGARYTPRASRP
jgi:O-methyltransferase involved in polyketide biosynthesis